MNILYLGDNSLGSTSSQRVSALARLGHTLVTINPIELHPSFSRLQSWFHYRTGYRFVQHKLSNALIHVLYCQRVVPDVVWVDSGEYLGPQIIIYLKSRFNVPILLFNIDNPTGCRDWRRFATLRSSAAYYDLCVCVRPETCLEMSSLGAKRTIRVWRSYDEIAHVPSSSAAESPASLLFKFSALFVGTFIPGEGRDRFISNLIQSGLPIIIYGNGWSRSHYYHIIRKSLCGPSLQNHSYADFLHSAGVCLGLLSHQNRDLHTTRSLEIPYANGMLCAERTSEHKLLYEEGREALFWDTWVECLSHCQRLLADLSFRDSLAKSGYNRVVEMGVGNEDVCRQILASL